MITSIARTVPQAIHTKDGISKRTGRTEEDSSTIEVLPHLIGEVAGTALSFGDWVHWRPVGPRVLHRHSKEDGDRLSLASWRATRTSGNEASCAIKHAKAQGMQTCG